MDALPGRTAKSNRGVLGRRKVGIPKAFARVNYPIFTGNLTAL